MTNKLTNKELAYTAAFGSLWGISEISLGYFLHNLYVPFTGLIQTFIGSVIVLTLFNLTGKKRSIIYAGLIAAIQKMLSFTAIKIFPFIGILMSSLIGGTAVMILGSSFIAIILAGGLMCCWPFAQSLLIYLIVYTPQFLNIYQDFFNRIGLSFLNIGTIIIIIFIIHFCIGTIAAIITLKLTKIINTRSTKDTRF